MAAASTAAAVTPARSIFRKVAVVIILLMALDMIRYHFKRMKMKARARWFSLPFLGDFPTIVADPTKFWDNLIALAPNGISAFKILTQAAIFVTNPKFAKQIFDDQENFTLFVHPNSPKLLGEDNLVYMSREDLVRWRRAMVPNLKKAEVLHAAAYTAVNSCSNMLRKIAARSPAEQAENDVRYDIRLMNAHLSLKVFLGGYLQKGEAEWIADDLIVVTNGFIAAPVDLPFTDLGKGKAASQRIMKVLHRISDECFRRMKNNEEPLCVLDRITDSCIKAGIKGYGRTPADIAHAGLDFCFAAQDATTSALCWCIHSMEKHPEVADKIREELDRVLDKDVDFTEALPRAYNANKLPYLRAAAINQLQYRPPVPMVPHIARHDTELGDHKIEKGTIAFASVMGSKANIEGADRFEPDPDNMLDPAFKKVLCFGGGPHMCPGRFYASNTVALFMATLVHGYDVDRIRKPGGEDIIYLPTLYPRDSLYVMKSRAEAA
ncbi:Cytochrome P450 710A1 [Hondaea fermentalgiana]|uniref:Cytochrome P450 710A1 n=1 Tax=Hondaea fermentalgiana TaxID=2315210 RepID=A0A2R5GTY7_9STRA|nr:Cytochrome P450 710A1 [Hondaea fermentalgiana]|eukprot:GBG33218.1 Cytochrome P450 710A1 [Hondaea fermentalgiana]